MLLLLAALESAAVTATAPPSPAFVHAATLSFVAARGNSEGETLGFADKLAWKFDHSALVAKAGMIRSKALQVARRAVGTGQSDFELQEQSTWVDTAETYTAGLRYDDRLKDKDRYYWYAGGDWERNRPAGIQSRTAVTAGFGRIWVDTKKTIWRTDAGFGGLREQTVVAKPDATPTTTFNLTTAVKHVFGQGAEYGLEAAYTDNLRDQDDYQAVVKQGLQVAMTRRVALKVGLDLSYRNRPNLIPVTLYSRDVDPVAIGSVGILAKRLDSTTTTSLVITF